MTCFLKRGCNGEVQNDNYGHEKVNVMADRSSNLRDAT